MELLPDGRGAAGRLPGAPGGAGHARCARRAPGARRRGQGRHDPPRDERREPARRSRPRASRCPRPRSSTTTTSGVTRRTCPRAARSGSSTAPTTRRCSSCACTPRSSSVSGCRRRPAGKDVWKHRYREINDWERYLTDNGFRIVKLFLNLSKEEQRRRFLAAHRPAREELEVLGGRRAGASLLGRLPEGVLRDAVGHQHRVGAVVRDPRRPQVVRAHLRLGDHRERADQDRSEVPQGDARGARRAPGDEAAAGGRGPRRRRGRPVRGRGTRRGGEGRRQARQEGRKKAGRRPRRSSRRRLGEGKSDGNDRQSSRPRRRGRPSAGTRSRPTTSPRSSASTRRAASPRRRPPSCCRRTAPTSFPSRRASRAGGGSSTSTAPTCRSSC